LQLSYIKDRFVADVVSIAGEVTKDSQPRKHSVKFVTEGVVRSPALASDEQYAKKSFMLTALLRLNAGVDTRLEQFLKVPVASVTLLKSSVGTEVML
jgi:hypothetical protein